MEIEYTVHRELCEISAQKSYKKLLRVVSWGNNPPKVDIRIWQRREDGLRPGKGIALTVPEAQLLAEGLQRFLSSVQPPDGE